MNRIKQAWLALTGRLPEVREVERRVEVEVPVYGDACEVEVYRAIDPRRGRVLRATSFGIPIDLAGGLADWHGNYFSTCEQAFKECPGAEVVSQKVWRIGAKLYETPKLVGIKIQPKPKRPKGKVRNG